MEVQGGEETLLPADVEDGETAGSCNSKETSDTCIQLIYMVFLFLFFCFLFNLKGHSYRKEGWNIK